MLVLSTGGQIVWPAGKSRIGVHPGGTSALSSGLSSSTTKFPSSWRVSTHLRENLLRPVVQQPTFTSPKKMVPTLNLIIQIQNDIEWYRKNDRDQPISRLIGDHCHPWMRKRNWYFRSRALGVWHGSNQKKAAKKPYIRSSAKLNHPPTPMA